MKKNILVFSNGEKIGDGLIKLPLLNEIKKRLPNSRLIWMTNKETTVYNNKLKNIAGQYIDEIIEQAEIKPFFWQKISNKYNFNKINVEYILDTQKAVIRTIALKRIKCNQFISGTASGIFSTKKIVLKPRQYLLYDLLDLLNFIKKGDFDNNFKFPIPNDLYKNLENIFKNDKPNIGFAPGAGEENKIWAIENFVEVAKYYEKKLYNLVFFLGPQEIKFKNLLRKTFPESIFPEELIKEYSSIEVVMATTKFLSCALSNDSGVSHMLSTNHCPLVKLFGPKDSEKFTPLNNKNIKVINSRIFGSKNINAIKPNYVIEKINDTIANVK